MIDQQFIDQGGLPLEQLTEQEDRLIEGALKKIWENGEFAMVTPARTRKLTTIFAEAGADALQTHRLTRHFDAATRLVFRLPPTRQRELYENLTQRFGPRPRQPGCR